MPRIAIYGAGVVLLCAYVSAFFLLTPLPLQDLPGHLARAVAMHDLIFHQGAQFAAIYRYQFLFVPYWLGDFLLACLVGWFGPDRASTVWSILVFLSLPAAVLFYLRNHRIDITRRSVAAILSLYLATDWSFLMGFLSYRLAVAMTLVTLSLADSFRDRSQRNCAEQIGRPAPFVARLRGCVTHFVGFAFAVAVGYLLHFTTVVFICAALGASGLLRLWLRRTRLRTEIALFAPIMLLLLWHFTVVSGYRDASDEIAAPSIWGTWSGKLARLDSPFIRYSPGTDVWMLLLFLASLCALALPRASDGGRTLDQRIRDFASPEVLEMLALAVAFLAMFFLLPMGYADAFYVDVRPLPLAIVFLMLALLLVEPRGVSAAALAPDPAAGKPILAVAIGVATLLASVNLFYLAKHLARDRAWLAQYRSVIGSIPVHGRVLPVFTVGSEGTIVPFMHVDCYVVIDRAGIEPYVFSADNGNPMKYFRYIHKPYDPHQTWYGDLPRPRIDWGAVARDYDYVLVTNPYSADRLAITTTEVNKNGAAALLAIVRR